LTDEARGIYVNKTIISHTHMAIATIEVRAVNVPMLENGSHAGQKKNMSFFSNLCISIFSLSLLAVPTALAEKKEDEGWEGVFFCSQDSLGPLYLWYY
jgi:hypothetical protein